MRDSVACSMVLSCEALAFDISAFIVNIIYYINIYIIFYYIACFVPCIVCWCYVVCTASATSEQQGKARRVHGSYTQAVDKPVDKFEDVDFGCG